ncbi:MAG TPA: peptide-methionine (S)-S-oxide reductase MsrA [Thermoplasmata archaeon]|nr:peptide-methionine (S)-S-oxide reductase MsrA [Thermoplasmata archaeon]HUJ77372.1 peptide-methionine (S)-S-oxide reductase MsrA [Thermoplasmata archaeon]
MSSSEGTGRTGTTVHATLGGGCFWCTEAVFDELEGVVRVTPGYSGGAIPNPTYEDVCEGGTGHAEVVDVEFDPSVVSFPDLLRIFFTVHDPTTPNRQGADVGPQYRSAVFYRGDGQRDDARAVIAEIDAAGIWPNPIVTEVTPFRAFYPAEEYHREYFRRNPGQGYCRAVIAPKVAKFRHAYAKRLKARATTA